MTKGYAHGVHAYQHYCSLFQVTRWQKADSKRRVSIQLFQKRLSERLANGECRRCTTERNCGYAIWYAKFHKLRSPCVKMNTPTMNVCLRVLDSKDKRNSRIFKLKDVPRFLVWTAYCLRLYIASHKKFRNIALNCCFRMTPCNWMLKNMGKPYNPPLNVFTKWRRHHSLA